MTHAALLLRLSPADLSVGTQGHHRPRKADVTTMSYSIDQLLPSLQSLGLWTYWVLALFAFLEATIVTGIIAPGGLVVIAGGVLAQRGYVDFFDMAWFVAAGAVIGSELSFYLGRVASNGLKRTTAYASSRHITRARGLLDTYGGFAIVIGRFFGPLSAFVPFSAAMAGMGQRKFRVWNLLSAVPYALVLPAVGYFSGHAIGILGAAAPRLIAVGATTLIVIFVLWLIIRRVFRSLPLLAEIGRSLTAGLGNRPFIRARLDQYPGVSSFVSARFRTGQFLGLTATLLVLLFIYIAGAWAESVFDFMGSGGVISTDTRIANILYTMRDPNLITVFTWITDAGGRHGVIPMLVGATVALLILRRFDLLTGMWIAAIGNQATVTLLKSFFARPRSTLGYFVETSGSFPSGHAAGSVAVWAMLFYLAWRLRLLTAATAVTLAVTMVFLIGLSRIYLIEHYVSDVVNGYLVGGVWLILGIAFCEWRRTAPVAPVGVMRKRIAAVSVALALATTGYFAFNTANPLNPTLEPVLQTTATPATLIQTGMLPATTQTLTGVDRQKVNLIVTVPDQTGLKDVMTAAGWVLAPSPGPFRMMTAVVDEWTGRPVTDPIVVPTFWDNRPNKLAFTQTTTSDTADTPVLHARFWDSRFRLESGAIVYVATITRERQLDGADEESITPDTGAMSDKVLGQLAADLTAAGAGTHVLR
ncbi:MAG: phosphatase PAP2 family protein [Sulfitobacter sp.]|uniref:phosphatase PAP2 family protein n=1 Tax=Sulfitobacter sp. TaxID=1903071 RepID=UPI004059E5C4